ncbi:MAG: four helix bundle protein [Candidatus Uhrbacteria bacterium]
MENRLSSRRERNAITSPRDRFPTENFSHAKKIFSTLCNDSRRLPPPNDSEIKRELTDVPVLHTFEALYLQWSEIHAKFPKAKRYSLGTKCDETLLDALSSICKAAYHEPAGKRPFVEDASASLEVAKVLFRTAKAARCLTNDQYVSIQAKLNEIGRMVGGWMRFLK